MRIIESPYQVRTVWIAGMKPRLLTGLCSDNWWTLGLFGIAFRRIKGDLGEVQPFLSLDGTGNFVKINDAIAAAPNFSTRRFYIHVKPGTYHEIIIVSSQKTFIALIGDDASTTIIVSNRSNATGFSTASSATLSKLYQ
ncbi:unnamed protein product [Citrullus colocynthis]|uniref:Pectinesterase catalytic domain-containing protein n=1 Tax=Citrullus colocynthis TaxID=252529 RepID=A0ABP0XP48_9ROSI